MRKFSIRRLSLEDLSKRPVLAWRHLHLSPLSAILLCGLSAMSLVAALFTLYALYGPADAEDRAIAPEWKPPTLAIAPLDPPKSAEDDLEALSRPIFSKSRKPSTKSAAAPTSSKIAVAGALSVKAIIRSNQTAKAFLLASEAPDGVWLKIGDKIDAWTITAIAPREVVLQSGEQTTKLNLYVDPSPAAAASAMAGRQMSRPDPQDAPSDLPTAATPAP